MGSVSLTADCSRCAALCCAALAFDKSDLFAIDKKADEPCPRLADNGQCSVHAQLDDLGFGGCVLYTCDGAGQRVTQEVFAGESWQEHPETLTRMTEAFRVLRRIHKLLVLLEAASKLPLDMNDTKLLGHLGQTLDPSEGWDEARLESFDIVGAEQGVQGFLKQLQRYVRRDGR